MLTPESSENLEVCEEKGASHCHRGMWVTEEKQSWGTLQLKAISERQEYSWNHTQGNVMSESLGSGKTTAGFKRNWMGPIKNHHQKKKKKDKEKKPGCKKSSLPVENYYCQITGYALKAAFMYIPSIVLWDDPAIKDTPNHCLLSWKRYLLSEATLKNLNSLQGNTKMSRLTDIRQDRY